MNVVLLKMPKLKPKTRMIRISRKIDDLLALYLEQAEKAMKTSQYSRTEIKANDRELRNKFKHFLGYLVGFASRFD